MNSLYYSTGLRAKFHLVQGLWFFTLVIGDLQVKSIILKLPIINAGVSKNCQIKQIHYYLIT